MSLIRRVLAPAVLAVGAVLVTLVLVEIGFRVFVPVSDAYRMLLPGERVFEPDTRFVHGIAGPARYVVNQQGIRGREFGPDSSEFRILLVGGSTTECNMLDESENWGSVLERELDVTGDRRKVWIGNVGRSGLASRDHAVTIKHLLPQYPRIDVVVVLVGVNDLTAALRQTAYRSPAPLTDPNAEAMQVRNAFALSPGGFREVLTADMVPQQEAWYRKSRLFQLAKRARTGFQATQVFRGIAGGNIGQWRQNRQSASTVVDQLPDLTQPLADYRQHLQAVVREAKRGGATVVFLTQPALWKPAMPDAERRLLWLGGTGSFQEEPGHTYYSPAALATAMNRYNETLLSECRDQGLQCLDLASALPKDTVMFYDDVHFTEAGAAAVGRLVAEHLRGAMPATFARKP
jgi:lysophospholipase L1-like esterase